MTWFFLKLDCNEDNKPVTTELGIRMVPTFKILKDGKVIKEVVGAKFDELLAAIDAARFSVLPDEGDTIPQCTSRFTLLSYASI
ncbi:hypothetical protein Bca4012_068039 [Brassica carinata]